MSGSIEGGRKAAEKNKKRFGENWYAEIGKLGGSAKVPKGFGVNRELAREAGRKGGTISRRRKQQSMQHEEA